MAFVYDFDEKKVTCCICLGMNIFEYILMPKEEAAHPIRDQADNLEQKLEEASSSIPLSD